MAEIIVKTKSKTITINNLTSVWIQKLKSYKGYVLCYEDDNCSVGQIYWSTNKDKLKKMGEKIMDSYLEGKERISIKE